MKVLVALCAVAACVVAKPFAGYAYSAAAPLTSAYSYAAPYYAPHLAYAAPAPIAPVVAPAVVSAPIPAPVGIKTQYYAQDFTGLVSYGHTEPFQAQSVVQDAAGNKVGSFSYVNPDGKVIQTNYIADHQGYRVASNDLPVAPEVPAVAPVALPEPVQDTPEVAEAKAKFFNEFEEVKSRARRSVPVQTPASTSPLADPAVVAAPVAVARVVAPIAPIAPLAPVVSTYSTPVVAPYSTPLAYPYSYNYPYYPSVVYSK